MAHLPGGLVGERDREHLVRLLWRDEVLFKLNEMGLGKGVQSKPKLALYAVLAKALALKPDFASASYNLANALLEHKIGRLLAQYARACNRSDF